MKKNKTLLLVNNSSIIPKLKNESAITFLFPVTGFCVGFTKTYKISEITEEGFIFLNRILDNKGINEFKELLKNLPTNIKGIVFDDLGILNILLETKNELSKILYLNHFNCNYESINSFLDYVDSVVISTDITTSETKEILAKAPKPLVLFAFGYVQIMYSRRTLLSNYNKHFNAKLKKDVILKETLTKQELKAIENEYGTVIYPKEPFNNLSLRYENNILYNLINGVFLTDEEIINIITNEDNLEELYPYKYLSKEETIFKIKEGKND